MKQLGFTVTTILAVLGGVAAWGVTQTPHLQPSPGVFAEPQFSLDYQLAVRKVLFPQGMPQADFSAVVLPSFTAEWTLFLHGATNGHRIIELRVVDGQVWGALQSGEQIPNFTAYREPIDEDVATEVVAALIRALRDTAYPKPDTRVGLDGVTYYFSSFIRREGTLSGQVWSPDASTDAGKLVALLEALREFVEPPPQNGPANEADIRKAAMEISKPHK